MSSLNPGTTIDQRQTFQVMVHQPNNPKMATSKLSQISSEDYHLKPVAKCPA